MEKASGASETEPEVLTMDEPAQPRSKLFFVFFAIFISLTLLIAANWGYLSESLKEDREAPAISPIKTKNAGFTQKIKFNVNDDIKLGLDVKIRVHFWATSDNNVNKSLWKMDYSETLKVLPGTTITNTLRDKPEERPGWYVWVDATDAKGKKTTVERIIFSPETDEDW